VTYSLPHFPTKFYPIFPIFGTLYHDEKRVKFAFEIYLSLFDFDVIMKSSNVNLCVRSVGLLKEGRGA